MRTAGIEKDSKLMVVLGAGGHARVVLDILNSCSKADQNRTEILDDHLPAGTEIGNYIVAGPIAQCKSYRPETGFIIAIGDNQTRKRIAQTYPLNYVTLIHSSAVIGSNVEIGEGTVIMAGAVINSGCRIGKHCIVNTGATVDHDCVIHDFVHISPGAHLGGTVEVGTESWIGIGACVRNNLTVCKNSIIGAGAAVVDNIMEPGVYVGVPACRME